MGKILLVEDADSLREVLTTVMEREGYTVRAAPNFEGALKFLKTDTFSCVLCDFKLPGRNGIELLQEVREISKTVPFILMTAYGSINIAVEAMKLGANDFLCKPFEPSVLSSVLKQVMEHRRIIEREGGSKVGNDAVFVTESPVLQKIFSQARKVAAVDSSVLILGESGTGKELFAQYIHDQSTRRNEKFLAVNCAAIPTELLESEFFGHEAGAFTGATQTRIGMFELASEGTIFLDEVGDMPLPLQVKLLRALQEREIKRVGGSKVIKINPRVIAATNVNIEETIESGKLREDFYYRLAVVTFTIPPLREREGDITLLVDHFIKVFCEEYQKPEMTISADARKFLCSYGWPGNARELRNVVERAVVMAEDVIKVEHLGISLDVSLEALNEATRSLSEISDSAARKAEVEAISKVLALTGGNKTKAAQLLGVCYKTLLQKVKEYEIGVEVAEDL